MQNVTQLLEKAIQSRANAYAPYSKFLVGACVESSNGNLYSGCNVENASYGLATCAETNAISAMLAAGERQIAQVVVVVEGPGVCAPCGACRQRLLEFATPNTLIHLHDLEGTQCTYKMSELLPHAFSQKDLKNSLAY